MKKIGILGSTGSIGTQTLEIVRAYSGELKVTVLAAGSNVALMEQQMREFAPEVVVMWSEQAAKELRARTEDIRIPILCGMEGLLNVSVWDHMDILVTALVGMIGIRPTIAAIKAGKADRTEADSRFSKSAADFSFELLRKTVEADSGKGKSENTLISPDSVLTALVMTENGAKGQTLSEMQDALSGGISVSAYNKYLSGMNHRLTSSKNVRYHVANSIWTRKDGIKIRKNFLKKNKAYHNASLFRAPFNEATVRDMNRWVSGNTRGMIRQIVDSLSPEDQVVLINAIAFEGAWEEKFNRPLKETFTTDKGEPVEADMLHQREMMNYLTVNGGKGFVKYYAGRDIAFAGMLPPEGVAADEFIEGLTGADFISAWKAKEIKMLDVSLPDGDGVSLCKQWRSEGLQVPILFLTAKDEELDVVRITVLAYTTNCLQIEGIVVGLPL